MFWLTYTEHLLSFGSLNFSSFWIFDLLRMIKNISSHILTEKKKLFLFLFLSPVIPAAQIFWEYEPRS